MSSCCRASSSNSSAAGCSGRSATRTGRVLANRPIIDSTPSTCGGRPAVTEPKTTSSRPVSPPTRAPQQPCTTELRVRPRERAQRVSAAVVSPSRRRRTAAGTPARRPDPAATRTGPSRPASRSAQARRAASRSARASQARYARYGAASGRAAVPPAPWASSSWTARPSDQPSSTMWWTDHTSRWRRSPRRISVNRMSGGRAGSNRRSRSSSARRRASASRSSAGRPDRSVSCQGRRTSLGTTWTGSPVLRLRKQARRLGWRRRSASAAVRSRPGMSSPSRSATSWRV